MIAPNPHELQPLADEFGGPLSTLTLMGIVLHGDGWRIPLLDNDREIIGHALRYPGGETSTEKGGKAGLISPPFSDETGKVAENPIVIVRGFADTMTAKNLGLNAIGILSPKGVIPYLKKITRDCHALIIFGNDSGGMDDAKKVAKALEGVAASVRVKHPPEGTTNALHGWVADLRKHGEDDIRIPSILIHGFQTIEEKRNSVSPSTLTPEEIDARTEKSMARMRGSIKKNGLMSGAAAERMDQQRRRDNRADEYGLTDLENGERFAVFLDGRAVYVELWKCWLIFDGTVWRRDETGLIKRLARKCIKKYLKRVADMDTGGERDKEYENARRMESKSGMAAMLSMAQFDERVAKHPENFDTDDFLFNVQNGTIDLRTGKSNPHDPADLITRISPVGLYENAETPSVFVEFMGQIFPDEAIREYVYLLLGIFLTGDIGLHVFWIFHGGGANGKSTLIDFLLFLLAEYGGIAPDSLLIQRRNAEHPTEIAGLMGKRFIVATESDEGGKLRVGQMKKITGDEFLTGRFMKCNYFTFRRTHKTVLVTNHKPRISEDSEGAWRRIRYVPFAVHIPEAEQDRDLPEKLRVEAPQILAVLVRYCVKWMKAGKRLETPEGVRVATEAYRSDEDALGDFIAARLVQGPGATITRRELMERYENWAKAEGIKHPLGPRKIYDRLKRVDGVEDHKSDGVRGFKGIGSNGKSDENETGPPI